MCLGAAMSNKVNELIKPWTDKIYAVNPKKYKALVRWVVAAQRTYKVEVINETLQRFYKFAESVNDDWWGYLDRTIEDVEGKQNGRESEAEHNDRKAAEAEYSRATFGGREIRKDPRQNR